MRRGEQSSPTITRVEQLVASINSSSILPPGVRIERIYDRKDLIDITTHTVLHNMVVGIGLIVLLQWLFLGDLRSALIVGATIPFALFFAVIILVLRGESANLLSVGAIDFGLIVDATVIMVEAIFRRLSQTTVLSRGRAKPHLAGNRDGHEEPCHPVGRRRRVALDLLCRRHHHRRVPAAVHPERRRGQHLRTDGEDLCLRAGRRPARDLHGDAGAERADPAVAHAGDRDLHRPLAAPPVHAGAALGGRQPQARDGRRRRAGGADGDLRPPARARIPAQARGGQSVDPRHHAADHLAGRGQRLRQRDAPADPQPARRSKSVVSQHGRPDDGTDAAGLFNAEFFAPLQAGRANGPAPRTRTS